MESEDVTSQFVDFVRQWVKIDDVIREQTLMLREKKEERKLLEEQILNIMKKTDQDVLNISSGGTLRMSVSKTKSGIKEEYLRDILSKFTNTVEEATLMTNAIMSERPTSERVYLKRCQPRHKP